MATRRKPTALEKFTALVQAQTAARDTVEKRARKATRARTKQMTDTDWRDYEKVTRFAADQKRIVNTYQRQIAALVNAYQARQLSMLSGKTASPVRQVTVENLRGIPDTSTYGRLADYFRYLRDNDDRLESVWTASELVADRTEEVASLDLLLAHREQEHRFLTEKKNLTGWRYVIHPELAKSGVSCGLCIAASQRVYSVKRRRAIHAFCNCEAVPTGEFDDLGLELNQDDLNQIYEAAGGTTAREALVNTRFSIREHGELGPVLTYKGNRFRGPRQVAEDTSYGKPVPLD